MFFKKQKTRTRIFSFFKKNWDINSNVTLQEMISIDA